MKNEIPDLIRYLINLDTRPRIGVRGDSIDGSVGHSFLQLSETTKHIHQQAKDGKIKVTVGGRRVNVDAIWYGDLMMYMFKSLIFAMLITFSFSASAIAGGDAASGEKLFNSKVYKCKVCHKLTEKKKVGPGLKGVTSRRSEEWLTKWLTDPKKIWEENDAETQEMRKWKKGRDKAKKTKMRMKKNPSGQEVADIIAFLKKNDTN